MKNNKKIIISAMTLSLGIALLGSVTSTFAWFQFSTRANAAYVGSSAGTSGNLQLRIKGEGEDKWTTLLTKEAIATYLTNAGYLPNAIQPVTPKLSATPATSDRNSDLAYEDLANDGTDHTLYPVFYVNPELRKPAYSQWVVAHRGNFVSFPLELQYVSRDGTGEANVAKDVFLSELLIQEDDENPVAAADISDAVRVHIQTIEEAGETDIENNFIISKKGGTTLTHGRLDLDGDGNLDQDYSEGDLWGFSSAAALQPVIYGGDDNQYEAYAGNSNDDFSRGISLLERTYFEETDHDLGTIVEQDDSVAPILAQTDEDFGTLDLSNLNFTNESAVSESKSIGSTVAFSGEETPAYLTVVVTIWVEGWHYFSTASTWDMDFANSMFNVGIQFAVDIN